MAVWHDLVLRLPDQRHSPQDFTATLIDTPAGRLPVSIFATMAEEDSSNQIGRENGRRRMAGSCFTGAARFVLADAA